MLSQVLPTAEFAELSTGYPNRVRGWWTTKFSALQVPDFPTLRAWSGLREAISPLGDSDGFPYTRTGSRKSRQALDPDTAGLLAIRSYAAGNKWGSGGINRCRRPVESTGGWQARAQRNAARVGTRRQRKGQGQVAGDRVHTPGGRGLRADPIVGAGRRSWTHLQVGSTPGRRGCGMPRLVRHVVAWLCRMLPGV